ncbi:NADH:flavin oxidoreductase/NADH oxidase [Mycena amicta]|nr:NADH:flavin oxidoreductase/NADH oxidase [Mycena amicta]
MSASTSQLFQATRIGDIELSHRVVFAPVTRYRGDDKHAPLPHVAEYYEQRASTPGSLLVTEATFIAARAGGYKNVPGIWSDEHIAEWKQVTDRVHAKGSYIFLQLHVLGRAAEPDVLAEDNLPYVSASNVPLTGRPRPPRPLTKDELKEYLELYATAATNAVNKASFDGVEIHGANGYLLDQFLHESSNTRTDEYGGPSVENRTRFPLEVAEAVVKAVGQKKTGFRVSPWSTFQDMYIADPKPTYSHLITQLRDRYPELAYLHIVEPRADGDDTSVNFKEWHSNDFIRDIWGDRPLIHAGGYTRQTAMAAAEQKPNELFAFGRYYIANPDLPYRLLNDIALTVGTRAFYYAPGSSDPKGFTDYPFAAPLVAAAAV